MTGSPGKGEIRGGWRCAGLGAGTEDGVSEGKGGGRAEPDGLRVVCAALSRMPGAPPPEHLEELAPYELADVLLDHGEAIDGTRLLYFLTCILADPFDEEIKTTCERHLLLLDHFAVSEESIVAVFTGFLDGSRRKPFARWGRKIVRQTLDRCRGDESMVSVPKGTTPRLAFYATIAYQINRLDEPARRIGYLSWVEGLTPSEVADRCNCPLERVELILALLLENAKRAMGWATQPDLNFPKELEEDGTDA